VDVILRMVGRARGRLTFSRFRQLAVYHVAGGAAVATLAAWIDRPGFVPVLGIFAVALVAGLISAAIHARVTRPSIRTAALALDRASGLRERLATALLVGNGTSPAELAVLEDASRIASSADPAQIPLRRVRRAWWPAIPPLIFVASLALPRLTSEAGIGTALIGDPTIPVPAPIRKEESAGLRRRAFDLERAAGERDLPELKELAQAMRQISEDMRRSEMSQAEALSKLSRLEDKAKERKKELSEQAGLRDAMMRNGENGASSAAGEEAARRAEELDRKVQELKSKLEKAKDELAKAGAEGRNAEMQAALMELGRELEDLGAKDMGELGRRLEKLAAEGDAEALAKMLETLDGELEDLEDALDGLEMLEGEIEALQAMKGRFAGAGKECLFCGKSDGG
jgi:hypothetical protein